MNDALNKRYLKFAIIALAILVLFICSFVLLSNFFKSSSGPEVKVNYPKAYALNSDNQLNVWKQNPVKDDFSTDLTDFSFQTAAKLLTEYDQINYSPLSLYYALAMTSTGANGKTADEFQTLLGQRSNKDLSIECGNLFRQLYRENKVCKLKLAYSLWMNQTTHQESTTFKTEFVSNAARNFYASSHIVDFSAASAGKAMSNWISEQTNHQLSPKIETTDKQLLALINTVYFKAQWETQFDQSRTADDTFTSSDGSTHNCAFMNQVLSASFTKGTNYIKASLPLKDNCSMTFVLPNEGTTIKDLASSPENLSKIFHEKQTHYGNITWKLPKIDFSSSLNLKDMLNSLGLTSAFKESADFSGITNTPLLISLVRQDTRIKVDEKGVTASAFTQINMDKTSMPQEPAEMILDRPFLYAITASNGSILFMGTYNGQ